MTYRLIHGLLLSAAAAGLPSATAASAEERGQARVTSLAQAIERGVRDTNGDDLPDAIVARVVIPARPSLQDVQAASNIAARLGYETTAATLPIVVREDRIDRSTIGLPIFVGRGNRVVGDLVSRGALDLSALAPGQGLVALVPQASGSGPGIVVLGSDDAGTVAASVELAARLPRLWNMTGIALPAIEEQALSYLRGRGVAASAAAVTAIVVDSRRRGIANLVVETTVAAGAERAAIEAFRALDTAHRSGEQAGVLDFAPAAMVTLNVVGAAGGRGESAVVRRIGANWRALTPPPPPPVRSAGASAAAGAARRMNFYRSFHDGMTPGGGGTSYGPPRSAQPAPAKAFDLSNAYSIDGWFGDLYADLTPDSTETSLILGGDPLDALGGAHIAARLGLESTGITLPIAVLDAEVAQPRNEPSPILVGRDNALTRDLIAAGKAAPFAPAGEGVVELVPQAFGDATATLVRGGDPAGTTAAALYLARRMPFIWDTRPGAATLGDVKAEAANFLAARSGAGQAARATIELDRMVGEIGVRPAAIDATLYLDQANPALATYLQRKLRSLAPGAAVSVATRGMAEPVDVFDDSVTLPWEGDAFRARLRAEVVPRVTAGATVSVTARVDEDPATRRRMALEAAAELEKAGAAAPDVKVLSAYKQGFFWLTEEVLPELKARGVRAVRIKVRTARQDTSEGARFQAMPARWIKELFPADEVYHRELDMPFDAFRIEQVDQADTIYSIEAANAEGKTVYSASFQPAIVEREFLEPLPGYARLEAETGHLTATVNGARVVDARITTDLDNFWDHYQTRVLPKLRDAMKAPPADGLPQPAFRDLKMTIAMSEPDYGIGEGEHIAPLEGLSQDLYMITNTFLRGAGVTSGVRVIPLVQPKAPGATQARFVLTRDAAAASRIDLAYRPAAGDHPRRLSRTIGATRLEAPRVTRIVVGVDRVHEIELRAKAADAATAASADEALRALADLQKAGLYRTDLSFDRVGRVALAIEGGEAPRVALLRNTGASKPSNVRTAAKASAPPLVAYDHIIDPAESESIVGALSRYPGVAAYKAGKSYEGRDISVLEITAPTASEQVSMAKLSAYKPSLMLVGRQHGNEPSSTSYMLELAERLATDPALHDIATKVNVAILPVMNPDGAALAGRIRETRPYDIAQSGYLNAIGRDVMYSGVQSTEAAVEPNLWRRWLPDIYLNAHGASSHEVVRPFSGYAATEAPTYSFRRGWYSLSFQMPRDPRYPQWTETALALRDAMDREISSDPVARAGNLRDYDRFRRWGHRFGPHLEPMEIRGDTMLFYTDPDSGELLGNRRIGLAEADRQPKMADWPFITLDGGTFEAADEGLADYSLDLAARNGFAAVLAHLKYLRDGRYQVQRIEEDAPVEGAKLTTLRVRPVLPPKD